MLCPVRHVMSPSLHESPLRPPSIFPEHQAEHAGPATSQPSHKWNEKWKIYCVLQEFCPLQNHCPASSYRQRDSNDKIRYCGKQREKTFSFNTLRKLGKLWLKLVYRSQKGWMPYTLVGDGPGLYLRSLDHLSRSSEAKKNFLKKWNDWRLDWQSEL